MHDSKDNPSIEQRTLLMRRELAAIILNILLSEVIDRELLVTIRQ